MKRAIIKKIEDTESERQIHLGPRGNGLPIYTFCYGDRCVENQELLRSLKKGSILLLIGKGLDDRCIGSVLGTAEIYVLKGTIHYLLFKNTGDGSY